MAHLIDASRDERQIRAVIEYLESIPEPTSKWPPGYLEDNIYSRWAVDFMLASMLAQPEKTPIRVAMEFEELMKDFSTRANSSHFGKDIVMIWDIGWREAVNIVDLLNAMS